MPFDPDASLDHIRDLVALALSPPGGLREGEVEELAEEFDALDRHCSAGEHFPRQWCANTLSPPPGGEPEEPPVPVHSIRVISDPETGPLL